MSKPTLHYFPVKGRGQLAYLISEYAGLGVVWEKTINWPGTLKDIAPFGQVPILVDGDLVVAQGNSIARLLAKRANLLGETDREYAINDSLLEEANDLFTILGKAHYGGGDKKEAYEKALVESYPPHFQRLEKLLGGQDYFTGKLLIGDFAIFSTLNIILDSTPTLLNNFPQLQAHYNRIAALGPIAAYIKNPPGVHYKP